MNPLHKSRDIIRVSDLVVVNGQAGPEIVKYLLQINRETRRFNCLNLIHHYKAFLSFMPTECAQPASRFIRRLRRPGIDDAGWVAVYL